MKTKSLLSTSVKSLFQQAIESELYASNLYKHIANQLQRLGFFGGQKYFIGESAEELTHYQKLVDYINDMGDVAEVSAVPKIIDSVSSIGDALDIAYETEVSLMKQYQKFYEKAEDEYSDCVTATFLIEFLQIQRKSVGEYGDLIARYNRCGNNEAAILEFDEYLEEK